MQITRRIRHFRENYTPQEYPIIKGEIYEFYCYEKIVNKYQNFRFIRLVENKNINDGFYITSAGALCYRSDSIDLGEFDIIGFDSKENVHWYEITRQKDNLSFVEDKLCRKKELMSKLFGEYHLYLIIPEEKEKLNGLANILYIPEPDYAPLIKKEYTFNFRSNNFIDLQFLNQKVKKFNYVEELIKLSRDFFKNNKSSYKSFLFERLYDMDNILNSTFSYYNVEKHFFGTISYRKKKVFKDDEYVPKLKATYKEITQIRKIKLAEESPKKKKKKSILKSEKNNKSTKTT